MTALRFFGIAPAAAGDRLVQILPHLIPSGLTLVRAGDLVAIVGPTPWRLFSAPGKRGLGTQMVEFQRLLEALMRECPIVPAAFQARFMDEEAAELFLIAHQQTLRQTLADFGDKRQFQINVSWDPKAMLHRFAQTEPVASVIAAAAATGRDATLGEVIQTMMEAQRQGLRGMFETLLRTHSIDCMILPGADETCIINATVLIEPGGEAALDRAVGEIDAYASEALTIKMAGPLPACAFASVHVVVPSDVAITQACERLRVARDVMAGDLKRAYHAAARLAHPDHGGTGADGDPEARSAYDLLLRVRSVEQELQHQGRPLPIAVPTLQLIRADMLSLVA